MQAEAYQNTVRKPLTELLPHLEEARRNVRHCVLHTCLTMCRQCNDEQSIEMSIYCMKCPAVQGEDAADQGQSGPSFQEDE